MTIREINMQSSPPSMFKFKLINLKDHFFSICFGVVEMDLPVVDNHDKMDWMQSYPPSIFKFEFINIKETLFLNMIARGGNRPTSCLQPWHDGLDFFCRKENHQKME